MGLWEARATAAIADALRSEVTHVARVAGAERMDLLYSEGGGEFRSGARVFLKHLA